MDIKPPSGVIPTTLTKTITVTPAQNPLISTNSQPAPDWRVSQLVKAIILNISDKQILLDIQGVKTHSAKPAIPNIQIGDVLKLQVEKTLPSPQFKIISLVKISSNNIKTVTQSITENFQKEKISLDSFFKNISHIANRPSLRPFPMAAEVNTAVRELFKSIPTSFNLKTGAQVKNQLENSGMFIESKIRNALVNIINNPKINKTPNIEAELNKTLQINFENDLGARLHRLASLLKPHVHTNNVTPQTQQNTNLQGQAGKTNQANLQTVVHRNEAMHTFLRQIESSLNTLQQNQLQNLNDEQANRVMWVMDIPIKDKQNIDLFKIRINEDESSKNESIENKTWNVTLQFDLSGLGIVKAHLKMQNNSISAQFYSEEEKTLSLFQEYFDWLRNRLNYNGLNVGNIEAKKGVTTPSEKQVQSPVITKTLDERT